MSQVTCAATRTVAVAVTRLGSESVTRGPRRGEPQHIREPIVYRPARVTRSATIVYQSATHSGGECVADCTGHSFGSECVTRDPSSGACRNTFGSRSCIDLHGSQLRVRMCDGRMGAAWWRGVPRHRATAPHTPHPAPPRPCRLDPARTAIRHLSHARMGRPNARPQDGRTKGTKADRAAAATPQTRGAFPRCADNM